MEDLKSLKLAAEDIPLAVEQLMEAHGQDVWNYAFLLTKQRESADDITQEVFLAALRKLPLFEGRSSPKTWLLTITRHKAINWLKSSFLRRVRLFGTVQQRQLQRSAEQEVLAQMGIKKIWLSVMQLPAKLREVLILHAHYGLSYGEIANVLQISMGTVKSRLYRARSRMELMLKEEGDFNEEG